MWGGTRGGGYPLLGTERLLQPTAGHGQEGICFRRLILQARNKGEMMCTMTLRVLQLLGRNNQNLTLQCA